MVSTTAGGRALKSAAFHPGATHGGSIDLDKADLSGAPPKMHDWSSAFFPARKVGA